MRNAPRVFLRAAPASETGLELVVAQSDGSSVSWTLTRGQRWLMLRVIVESLAEEHRWPICPKR